MLPNCFFECGPDVKHPYAGDISGQLDVDPVPVKYSPVLSPEGDCSLIREDRGGNKVLHS